MVYTAFVSSVLFSVERLRCAPWMVSRTGEVRQEQTSAILRGIKDQVT